MDTHWTERRRGVTVVHIGPDDGSLHSDVLAALRQSLMRCAAEAEPPKLIVDLSATDYFGGEFMSLLLDCFHRIKDRDGQFALCSVRPRLLDELHVTRLNKLLAIHPTQLNAFEAMEETELSPVF